MTKFKKLHPDLPKKVLDWLGYDGIAFFQMCLVEYGQIDAMWSILLPGYQKHSPSPKAVRIAKGHYAIPHIVHFREGMAVRNFIQDTGLCNNWHDHDLDNQWVNVIKKALELCEKSHTEKV